MLAQTVYATPLVRLGRFEARPEDALFTAVLPPGHHLVAFPETALTIAYERAGEFVVDPTAVTFYNPDEIYRRRAISSMGDRCNWVSVRPDLLDELLYAPDAAKSDPEPRFSAPVVSCPSDAFVAQRQLFLDSAAGAIDSLAVEERAIALLSRLIGLQTADSSGAQASLSPASKRAVTRAQELLAARFRQSCTVAEIARYASCSPFHLCRAFRAHTGFSLHGYRTALRLHHGYDRLTQSTDLTDLALDLGFASHSHFSSKFKHHFGCAPRSVARKRAQSPGLRAQ